MIVSKVLLRRLMPITKQPLTRARFTEDRLLASIEKGVRQYVILGSGYDTFALRHPRLGVTIYEIDLASTIALKRERARAAGLEFPDSEFNVHGHWEVVCNDSPDDQHKRYVEGRSDVFALPPLFWCLNLSRRRCPGRRRR